MSPSTTVLFAYAALSVGAFALYGWDKLQARRGGRRVSETRLHGLALLGGFAGAWFGMLLFRHKTRKRAFIVVQGFAALVHAAGWSWWLSR